MIRAILVVAAATLWLSDVHGQSATTAKPKAEKKSANPMTNLLGDTGTNSNEPIVTEIYADEAFFDNTKSMGTFTGHVKITDPRFNLQSDKLTVFLKKGEQPTDDSNGLEKAIADGNVGVVRERPAANGEPPTKSVGRCDHAVYTSSDGNVEMTGTPRVQQGLNMHVATAPDTVMILNQAGQLTTHGPSRTEIHQEAKKDGEETGDKPDKAKKRKQ